ncbi:MAG: hypothetical protein VZR09_09655, partial [Candidatus Gastranaerophilaceae bacterium]|nr:hypothetical protein [Candidatus Gastranaerophilaceae bacterium]
MKSGSGKRNLLLAATIVSLSVTMPMNVAYAETPSIPSRGVNSVYETTQVTDPDKISNHEYAFSTTDGSTTKYWNYNPILSKINGTHTTSSETYSSGAIEIYTGGADTPILYYTYTKPSEWTNTSRTDNITENINNVVFNRVSSYSLPWGATDLVGGVLSNTDTDNSAITINADFIQGNKNNYAGYYVGTGIFNHAVENNSKLGNISGDFVDNKASFGSAIFNYTNSTQHAAQLGDITGNFINNRTNDMGYYQSKQGGAIWNNGVIGNINGNFVGNFVGSNYTNIQAHGGAIFNRGGNIGNIEGNFLYNTASPNYDISKFFTNPISGAKAYGGAIFNGLAEETKSGASAASQAQSPKPVDRDSVIGNITGDFIGNMAYNAGGAIYNGDANGYNIPLNTTKSTIGDITGDFINNYAEEGGAIYNGVGIGENPTFKTINSITGNFIRNEAAVGGAIYNNVGTIGDINANFIENSGGAISSYFGAFNNINGNFTGNTDYNLGAAISVQGGIVNGNITGNFIDNSVSGTYESKGGAISIITSDTQGQISANFNDNSVTSTDSNAYGGAIYYEGGQTGEHGLDISNSTFTSNSATSTNANGYGGAIYNDGQIGHYETTINEGTYEEETKLTGGGLLGSTFSGNSASTSGGAIYNNSSAVINIISADFENNSANANGGAVFNEGTIGIDNGYGYITDGGFIDSSFRNNSATESGGAIYNNSSDKPVLITAKTKDITFSGNKAANGASIYNTSSGGTSITANGGNVTFTNNTPTDESGYGIYSAATVNLVANDGYSIKIDDSINISNPYADITVNQSYGYTGAVELNGKIKFNNSNQGIRVGFAGFDSGTLKLGQTPANDTYNYLQTAGNFTLDLQNEHAGDNLVLKQLSGTATMKLNVDYDATANSMDKITVNGGSGIITLNAVNVMNDNASFVDGTEATYLDGEVKNNITVISDAIQSTVAGTTVYTFTPDSTTHGLLTVTRAESYAGDLINAIQDDIADVHPNAYSMQENFTADRNFGALNTENREQFTIFGNSHTISGDNNTYTGIEVASGQTLNLDNVRFSNVKDYDVQNAGTLNLSGSNTINTITGATGNTNITGGLTIIDYDGSVVQNAVNMHGGGLKIMNHANVNKIVGDENHTGSYIVAYGGSFSSLEGTFKGSNTYRALDYNSATALTIDGVTFDSNAAGAIYHSWSGTVDSSISNSTFTNNSTEYEGGAYYQHSTNAQNHTVSFDNVTFTSNSAANKGGAILAGLNAVNKLNISNSTFTSNTVTSANGIGSAIYLQGIAGAENTPSSFTIDNSTFTSNGAGGVVYANGGNLTVKNSTFTSNSGDAIVLADNYQYWTIIGGQITAVYSPITANIVAETGNVSITGNSGWGIVGNKNHETDSALTLYAKSGNITINGNTAGGINNNGLALTLNADTGHNITINDTVSSTTGMTINAGGTHAGTVALNGALTLGSALNVNGGTLTLNDTAASSMANKDLVLNGGALKLDSVAAAAIVNTNLGLNGGKFDIANDAIDNLTFTNAINNAVNSYLALDVSLGDTNTADKITSDISGASTINVSDINFISDNKNGGEVQIAEGNIKSAITVSDVAGGYADVQYNNSTGILSFANKIDWLKQTNGANSGYRFTKTNNGIMPVNYTSGENNYTFYTDILKKNYTDDNSVAHDLKYTWNNATHTLSVTNSDGSALSTTKSTIVRTGDGSSAAPFVYTGDHVGNTAIGLNRWNNFGDITGDFVGNTNGAISVGMGVNVGDITGNFIGNTGGSAVYIGGDGSWGSSISSIKGDFIGNSTTGSGSAIQIGYWSKYSIGTVTGDFIGNRADESGGAIYVQSRGTTLTGNFINNYAGDVGGAMLIGAGGHGANVTVTGDFIGNEAVNAGGAIYSSNGGTTTLVDSSFIGNVAPEGAAIYMNAGELSVTAQNKDIEFTNNNSTGTAGGVGYGIYHKSGGYRPFALNAYEGRTITVNDKVYSEQKINLNCYYSGDWVGKNGTVIFNNEFTQTGATEISSNESNAGGGTVIFNGATSLGALDVSGTATLKLGAGAGTSTFGAVTFTRSPILDIANGSAQTLTVASIKGNSKLNIDLDFTGDSVLADAINISTGGQTGVLTLDSINALTSETGAIREFTNLAILTGETDGVTLALSDAIQQDPRFNGDAVETITYESDYTDTATFANTVFTNTEYSETKQKHLYVVDGTKLSFDETTTIPKHATGNVTTQDVLQALNQSTSAARSLATDDADATYTVGDNLGATGTGSLSVTGTTSGSDASTLNMNGKSGFELSNSDTTLALSNLNITGIKDVEGGLINITGENSSATLTSVNIGSTTNSAIVNNKTLNLAGNTTINTGIKGSGTMNVNGNVALNGALTLSGTTNVTGGTLKLGTAAAGSAFNNIAFSNTPTLDLQNTTIDTLNVDKITGNSKLNIDVNYASSLADTIQIATTGSSGTITVDSLNFLGGSVPTSFNVDVLTQGAEGDISGITLAISDALAAQYNDPTPTSEDYIKPYTYESNINFDKTDFTSEKWTRTTQKQLTVVDNTTSKGLNLNVNEISNEHKAGGAEDTHYDALQVLNQHEGTRTLKADGATANTYTVGDNLGTTATGTLNVTGKSSGSNLDMNNKTGFVVSNADTTLNLSNLNITNVSDTADGGLVTVSGTGSKANLENVTIASTTNSAISNAVELNLSGTNNLGIGIVGADGTTNITGGKTTVGSIAQNVVNITAGELEVANITATNGISNDGTLTLTGTANANTISGTGHTTIAGNVNNTGAINQAITVNGTKTLTTAANLIGGAVTNSGTVELTGGALGQTITGGDITIASGEVTSTVANLGGDITNDATLNLSGTLDKNIAGTEGIT